MQTWYSVSLGDGMLAPSPAAEIETSFTKLFNAHGKPIEMAVFTRAESEGRLHCEVIAYFSPAAATLAELLRGDLPYALRTGGAVIFQDCLDELHRRHVL